MNNGSYDYLWNSEENESLKFVPIFNFTYYGKFNELDLTEKMIYSLLLNYSLSGMRNYQKGNKRFSDKKKNIFVEMTQDEVARQLGYVVGKTKIKQSLSKLKDLGLIKKYNPLEDEKYKGKKKINTTNKYYVYVPESKDIEHFNKLMAFEKCYHQNNEKWTKKDFAQEFDVTVRTIENWLKQIPLP